VKEVEEKIFVTPQNNPRMKSLLNHNNLKTSTPLLHPSTILPGMKAPKSCPPAIECTKEESCEVGESPYGEISGITNAYGSYIKHEITTVTKEQLSSTASFSGSVDYDVTEEDKLNNQTSVWDDSIAQEVVANLS